MQTLQVFLGVASLAVGIGMIVARNRLPLANHARDSPLAVPVVWVALGLLLAVNGLLQAYLGLN